MKKLILLLSLLTLSVCAFSQNTDLFLKHRSDSLIRPRTYNPVVTANQFDLVTNSKVSILAPRLKTTSTTGYVWTATDNIGNGTWSPGGGGGGGTFPTDVTFILSGGKSFGKYTNGQTAPWAGLTAIQAMQDAGVEYINPAFNSFSVNQTQTVPVGTTISGAKTATWSISANSGVVSTMDIRDVTASTTLVAATPNDGTQGFTATTLQLNSNGASQTWRGIGNNSSPSGTFNSGDYTVTARYPRYYGPASARPTNSTTVTDLPINSFHPGASNFSFSSGTAYNKLYVILPPGVTIFSVIDLDASNANITAAYVLVDTVTVVDAGGTNRSYNLYEFVAAVPYSPAHTHSITTNN